MKHLKYSQKSQGMKLTFGLYPWANETLVTKQWNDWIINAWNELMKTLKYNNITSKQSLRNETIDWFVRFRAHAHLKYILFSLANLHECMKQLKYFFKTKRSGFIDSPNFLSEFPSIRTSFTPCMAVHKIFWRGQNKQIPCGYFYNLWHRKKI